MCRALRRHQNTNTLTGELNLGTSLVAQMIESACNVGQAGFNAWVRKIPWRREWQHTPVLLPGKSPGQRSPWGCIESDTTE